MFRNERQQARVCATLCRCVGLDGMWDESGPTPESISLIDRDGAALSSGERIMLLASWNVWNGRGQVTLADAMNRLDGKNLRALGTLMIAVAAGATAIDQWLAALDRA